MAHRDCRFILAAELIGRDAPLGAALAPLAGPCSILGGGAPGRATFATAAPVGIDDLPAIQQALRAVRLAGARVDGAAMMSIRIDAARLDARAVGNVHKIIAKQASLIAHAIGRGSVPFAARDEKRTAPFAKGALVFTFSASLHAGEVAAYVLLAVAIVERAIAARAASNAARPFEAKSAKYDFRCFLLRLGLVGDGYREAREQLLKRLPGSAAWRRGRPARVPRHERRIDAAIAAQLG